jgi:vesicle-associated membrane protein 4
VLLYYDDFAQPGTATSKQDMGFWIILPPSSDQRLTSFI